MTKKKANLLSQNGTQSIFSPPWAMSTSPNEPESKVVGAGLGKPEPSPGPGDFQSTIF